MYEMYHSKNDSYGNEYPTKENIGMFVATKVKSTGELNNKVLEKVILPEIRVNNRDKGVVLCDDFKGC